MGGSVFAGVGAGVSVVGLVFDHAVFGRIKGAVFILMAPEIVREVFRRYRYGHERALKPATSPLRSWRHKQGVQLHEQMFGGAEEFPLASALLSPLEEADETTDQAHQCTRRL